MNKLLISSLLTSLLFAAPVFAADQAASTPTTGKAATTAPTNLTNDEQKLGYVMGLNMGSNLRIHQINIEEGSFTRGLEDGLNNQPPQMTPQQAQEIMAKFQKEMLAKQQAALKAESEKNMQEGNAFMESYKKKPGVQLTNDKKIAYQILTKGTGPVPTKANTVSITYEGKLVNGMVFDSTARNNNKPVSLAVNSVIPGMQKVLAMMPVGSTWEAVIPPDMAYGSNGVGFGPIGPNETLIFKITLVGIDKSAAKA